MCDNDQKQSQDMRDDIQKYFANMRNEMRKLLIDVRNDVQQHITEIHKEMDEMSSKLDELAQPLPVCSSSTCVRASAESPSSGAGICSGPMDLQHR
jgi:predicted neutral ceramidase superfamily lipid hydrolase